MRRFPSVASPCIIPAVSAADAAPRPPQTDDLSPDPEAERLAVLARYNILHTPPDAVFDDLAYLAAQVAEAPMAWLGFFDHDQMWIKANHNLPVPHVPRAYTLLVYAGPAAGPVVVEDALAHERLVQHPMVAVAPKVRFYAGVPLRVGGYLIGVLEVMAPEPRDLSAAQAHALETVARQVVAQLEARRIAGEHAALSRRLAAGADELNTAYDATLASLARALDLRDREVEGHLQRVADITVRLARDLGVPVGELVHVRRGALLHDIGKMAIPDSVLLKPSALSDDEWEVMHQHPTYAYEMLSPISLLRPALDIPYCHHERWDGQGYPRQLQGEAIPLAARVFSVVDVWDALRSDRPYRPGWSEPRVRDYISKRAGADFDPRVVATFLNMQL